MAVDLPEYKPFRANIAGNKNYFPLFLILVFCSVLLPNAGAEQTPFSLLSASGSSRISASSHLSLLDRSLPLNGDNDDDTGNGADADSEAQATSDATTLAIALSRLHAVTGYKKPQWHVTLDGQHQERHTLLYTPAGQLPPEMYHLRGEYDFEKSAVVTEVGDIKLDGTQNTVEGLPGRGGKITLKYDNLVFSTFATTGVLPLAIEEPLQTTRRSNYVVGASGEAGFFNNELHIKTMYVAEGESERNAERGVSLAGHSSDVLTFITTVNPFHERLVAETEVDLSEYTGDYGTQPERDKAVRIKVGGLSGVYNYQALYEYIGPEYQLIRRSGPMRDREGFSLSGGAKFPWQTVSLSLSRYNDNTEKNEDRPQYFTYQGGLTYQLTRFKCLPVTLSYQKSILDGLQNRSVEPVKQMGSDTFSGRIAYLVGPWNLGLQARYYLQSVRGSTISDSSTATYTFTPSYQSGPLTATPSVSFNRTKEQPTGIFTDTYTANLALKCDRVVSRHVACELAGSYRNQQASDRSVRQDNYGINFGISYLLKKLFLGIDKPALVLQTGYNFRDDHVAGLRRGDFLIMFGLSSL